MLETIVVVLIVVVAAFFGGRSVYKSMNEKKSNCACKASCDAENCCDDGV